MASARTAARSTSVDPRTAPGSATSNRAPHGPFGPGMATAISVNAPGRTVEVTRSPGPPTRAIAPGDRSSSAERRADGAASRARPRSPKLRGRSSRRGTAMPLGTADARGVRLPSRSSQITTRASSTELRISLAICSRSSSRPPPAYVRRAIVSRRARSRRWCSASRGSERSRAPRKSGPPSRLVRWPAGPCVTWSRCRRAAALPPGRSVAALSAAARNRCRSPSR